MCMSFLNRNIGDHFCLCILYILDRMTNPQLTKPLLTQADILGFYDHLKTSGVAKDDTINGLSIEVVAAWAKVDCPPLHIRLVKNKIRALGANQETYQAKLFPKRHHMVSNSLALPFLFV